MNEEFSEEFKDWFQTKYNCTVEQHISSMVPLEADLNELAEAFKAGQIYHASK